MKDSGNTLFPVFVKLSKIQTLIVGGGNVGLEKLEALLKNDPMAKVTIIAPFIKESIKKIAQNKTAITLKQKPFEHTDLLDVQLVILATNQPTLHKKIADRVKSQQCCLLNVADTPHLCDFYLGATVKKGDLKIGISTNGKSPTFAKRFRQVLEETLPEETNELLNNLKKIRDTLKGDFYHKVKELNQLTQLLTKKE